MIAPYLLLLQGLIAAPRVVQTEESGCERTGRLVDEAGSPVALRHVSALAITMSAKGLLSPGSRVLGQTRTRSDGNFVLHLDSLPTAIERKQCVFDLVVDEDAERYARYVRLHEDVDLQQGSHDFGQRVAEKSETLATGVVVDDRGEVLEKATVHVVYPRLATGLEDPLPPIVDDNMRDDDGRFAILSSVTPEFVWLQAFAPDHLPSPVQLFRRGARDFRLEVTRFGSIHGRVLLDEETARIARTSLAIWVDAVRQGNDGGTWEPGALLDGSEFHRGPFAPGRWVLRAGFELHQTALLIPADAHAADGTPPVDVDLRGKIPIRHLEVVDAAGHPITTRMLLRQLPADRNPVVPGETASKFAVVGKRHYDDFIVLADGYRPRMLGPFETDQRVVLEPGLRVTFALPHDLALPNKPWRLAFAVDPLVGVDPNGGFSPGDQYSWSRIFAYDAPGEVTVVLPNSGKCDVWWMLVNGDERRRLVPRRIEIAERKDPQRIEIEPEPKEYTAALEKLKAR